MEESNKEPRWDCKGCKHCLFVGQIDKYDVYVCPNSPIRFILTTPFGIESDTKAKTYYTQIAPLLEPYIRNGKMNSLYKAMLKIRS